MSDTQSGEARGADTREGADSAGHERELTPASAPAPSPALSAEGERQVERVCELANDLANEAMQEYDPEDTKSLLAHRAAERGAEEALEAAVRALVAEKERAEAIPLEVVLAARVVGNKLFDEVLARWPNSLAILVSWACERVLAEETSR